MYLVPKEKDRSLNLSTANFKDKMWAKLDLNLRLSVIDYHIVTTQSSGHSLSDGLGTLFWNILKCFTIDHCLTYITMIDKYYVQTNSFSINVMYTELHSVCRINYRICHSRTTVTSVKHLNNSLDSSTFCIRTRAAHFVSVLFISL